MNRSRELAILKLLAGSTRFDILCELLENPDSEVSHRHLVESLGIHKASLTQQIILLRDAGLIHTNVKRKLAFNVIQPSVTQDIQTILDCLQRLTKVVKVGAV